MQAFSTNSPNSNEHQGPLTHAGVVLVLDVVFCEQHEALDGDMLLVVVGVLAAVGVVHHGAEQRFANVQAGVAGIIVFLEKHDDVARLGIVGLFEAQLLEMIDEIVALRPVGLGAVERRHGVHAGLWVLSGRPGVVLLPLLWKVNDVREIIVGVSASLRSLNGNPGLFGNAFGRRSPCQIIHAEHSQQNKQNE